MKHTDDIEALLPAYINGSLDDAEAGAVAEAITHDAALADEVRFLRALRDQLQATDTGAAPRAMGWQRLRRDIAAEQRREPPRRWRHAAMGVAAAVAVVVIALQASLLWQHSQVPDRQYIPLAAEQPGQIQIQFSHEATAAQIRQLLAANALEIVSGPSAAGVYRLRLRGDADTAAIQAVIAVLGRHEDVVQFVAAQ